jgi:uncharacterized membrane protein (UPF0127 family)
MRHTGTVMIEAVRQVRPAIACAAALTVLLASCGEAAPEAVLEIRSGDDTVEVDVEVADTSLERSRGLMGREDLPDDAGMVFLVPEPTEGSFWMKDTLIPLSVAFWDRQGRIFRIQHMEPCSADPCRQYPPGAPWTGAVEVNQGFFEEHGVEVGDVVRLER